MYCSNNMIVLSIDVGIKNLAVCCLEVDIPKQSYQIKDWNVFDLTPNKKHFCKMKNAKGEICNKVAKYIKNDHVCCKIHAKKTEFNVPTSEMNMKSLKKQRVADLYVLANKYNIEYEEKVNKTGLLAKFEEYISKHYFDTIQVTNTDDIHLVSIGRAISKVFDEHYGSMEIDCVLIENQISPIANKMKTIQGMIAQYFIMTSLCEIMFVSSINKLKLYDECKQISYKERKQKSIEICRKQIEDTDKKGFFDTHSKKDDLADSYLQGVWYIKEKLFK